MVVAGIATLLTDVLSQIMNILFAPILSVLMIILELVGCVVITVFYYPLVALLRTEAQLVTGTILQSLYSDALGLSEDGVIGTALNGMLAITGDIQNIFIAYGVVFIVVTFMTKMGDKAARMNLEVQNFAKAFMVMGISAALCFACSPIVNTLVNIGTGITSIVYDAIEKNQTDTSVMLVNELSTTKLLYESGDIIDWGSVIMGYNESAVEDGDGYNAAFGKDDTVNETTNSIKNAVTGTSGQETFRYARMFCGILGGILFLILPTILSLAINIFCLSFFITRIIELSVYVVFLPIPMADVYEHGLIGSSGGKHLRKIAALIFQGVVLYSILAFSQLFIGTIGGAILSGASDADGSFINMIDQILGGIGSVTLYLVVIIATDIMMLTLAKKSLEVATDITG